MVWWCKIGRSIRGAQMRAIRSIFAPSTVSIIWMKRHQHLQASQVRSFSNLNLLVVYARMWGIDLRSSCQPYLWFSIYLFIFRLKKGKGCHESGANRRNQSWLCQCIQSIPQVWGILQNKWQQIDKVMFIHMFILLLWKNNLSLSWILITSNSSVSLAY